MAILTPLLLVLLASLLLPCTHSHAASPAFPSYSTYAGKPYTVSYDQRSLRLNNEPVTFLSGSIHYPRSTPGMWPTLMRNAVADGLNMIEIYVFWNYHEPQEGQLDWSGRGNLTLFLDAIAQAGLFANLRIGPYVCAEWDYGGIPTWLAYKPGVRFRSYNDVWRAYVEPWLGRIINQTRAYFADRGGPIVLAQIENELYGADPEYVQWNGDMAEAFNVHVPWLMCNGQTANNTINTCNANDCTDFINSNGQSGRILKDQPALWTENEGWFQQWGDNDYPSMGSYSDRTPEDMSLAIARWFARGGSHMNYYMYHGGNHYDRTAAAGLTNKYADGVNFHSDGLPNEPKKSHLMRLHQAIARVSSDLVQYEAQYRSNRSLQWRGSPSEPWQTGTQQVAFVYGDSAFVESMAWSYVQTLYDGRALDIAPNSILIVSKGNVLFNTSAVAPATVERVSKAVWDAPFQWEAWHEGPYNSSSALLTAGIPTVTATSPQDHLNVTRDLTDYLYYTTSPNITKAELNTSLTIASASANAFVVFWDGAYMGNCYDASHQWTSITWQCRVALGEVSVGVHSLSLLSVSLGIENGMWSNEVPYQNHYKGIPAGGAVNTTANNFTHGVWIHRPYLMGEYLALFTEEGRRSVQWSTEWKGLVGRPLVWWSTVLPELSRPSGDGFALLLDLTGMGRGHFYVNGHDGGHYWLVRGAGSEYPTQWLYHVPPDWLEWGEGSMNRVTMVEELGGDPSRVRLFVSQMMPKVEKVGAAAVEA